MSNLNNYKNKIIGILGLGKSGKAAMNILSDITTKIFIYDDNLKINNQKRSVIWKHYEDWEWDKLHSLIISPGIKIEGQNQHKCVLLAKKFNVRLINEIQLLIERQPLAKIIGITGTNGKSTLVSLLSHIFNSNKINNKIGGNFGNPACLLEDPGVNGFIILELSSFQLLSISDLKLKAATIINISPDHIDYHGSFESYVKAKLNIIKFLKSSSKLFINHDDKNLINLIKKNENLNSENIQYISPDDNLKQSDNLRGNHNKITCKIAFEICRFLGLKENNILPFLKNFMPLPHRMEVVFSSNKVLIINDSKATNGVSTAAALSSYHNIYWIAGGLSKTNGIEDCIRNLKNVIDISLFGSSRYFFKKQLLGIDTNITITQHETLELSLNSIFDKINQYNKKKYTILFSPAAASFDQFQNFEDRGNKFKKLIKKIIIEKKLKC